jgi:hypothetical protein
MIPRAVFKKTGGYKIKYNDWNGYKQNKNYNQLSSHQHSPKSNGTIILIRQYIPAREGKPDLIQCNFETGKLHPPKKFLCKTYKS